VVLWDSYASSSDRSRKSGLGNLVATAKGGSVSVPSRALCWIGRKVAVFARLDTVMSEDNLLIAMICRNEAVG
jgi:hypothetical protein